MITIGIIGFGNMGSAIAEHAKKHFHIIAYDNKKAIKADGLDVAGSIAALAHRSQVVVLAVKPQDMSTLLEESAKDLTGKLVISIAAGLTTKYFETKLGDVRVIRAMPNLPAKVAKGMVCLCAGSGASAADARLARGLFERVGTVLDVREDQMDAVTAVSGSGPGFLFSLLAAEPRENWDEFARGTFMPGLSRAAQQLGFSSREATILASITTAGSLALLLETNAEPAALCAQVASKGGTTEAGLNVLRGDSGNLEQAVRAAYDRARELSKS